MKAWAFAAVAVLSLMLAASVSAAPAGEHLLPARGEDSERPRGQDSERPRGDDEQRPRGDDSERPRGLDRRA
jgi:hypothetical protein